MAYAMVTKLSIELVEMGKIGKMAIKMGEVGWFVLLDASDAGLAHDLGVNYAPKLANIGIGCPACVQTVTLDNPTPAQNPFGPALVHFQGAPDFSPTRIAEPGPHDFPLAKMRMPTYSVLALLCPLPQVPQEPLVRVNRAVAWAAARPAPAPPARVPASARQRWAGRPGAAWPPRT
jgi:hypothetical protein